MQVKEKDRFLMLHSITKTLEIARKELLLPKQTDISAPKEAMYTHQEAMWIVIRQTIVV